MQNQIVSREEWLDARRALLLKEKEATHLNEAFRNCSTVAAS
jgi:predicted dithiol-disulfide oxidoreductase (DUF899 family)